MYTLSEINIYPIKSLGGIQVQEAEVQERGLAHDRRWMLVDPAGKFLTQRQHAQMALLQVSLQPDGLLISHKEGIRQPLLVPFAPQLNTEVQVTIWDDTCTALEVSEEANNWFTDALQMEARLVYMPDNTTRRVDEQYALDEEIVSFADGYPFLLIGQSSLDDLNSRLPEAIPMNRFRPNFVVTGGEPFEEDTWNNFTIGSIDFRAAKPCARCVVTTIDQATAEKSAEPLRTLSGYRLINNKVMFGQNLVHTHHGLLRVGDQVEVLKRK